MAKNLIKVLESADNAGKYEELKDHLDPKFLSTLGLTPEGYIDELKKFSGENHGTALTRAEAAAIFYRLDTLLK